MFAIQNVQHTKSSEISLIKMRKFVVYTYCFALLATLNNIPQAIGANRQVCEQHIDVNRNKNLTLSLLDGSLFQNSQDGSIIRLSSLNTSCNLILQTDKHMLLHLTVRYVPKRRDCSNGYLHIGNDIFRIGQESMTSYKFCDAVWDLEIVSRGSSMWLTHLFNVNKEYLPETAEIHVVPKYSVTCNKTEFECSPVQCVPRPSICNGKIDCDNRRDEYCMQGSMSILNAPREPICFQCEDGNCIQPVLPLYDDDYGKVLSFLCDGYDHCLDGTDERKDMCYRTKSKVSDLLTCVPEDHRFGIHVAVRQWQDKVCDGAKDCLYNEDEAFCSPKEDAAEIEITGIVIMCAAVALLLSVISVCAYRTRKSLLTRTQHADPISSRTIIYKAQDRLDPLEVCRLHAVSEEPENV